LIVEVNHVARRNETVNSTCSLEEQSGTDGTSMPQERSDVEELTRPEKVACHYLGPILKSRFKSLSSYSATPTTPPSPLPHLPSLLLSCKTTTLSDIISYSSYPPSVLSTNSLPILASQSGKINNMEGTCNCGAIKVIINDPDLFGEKRRGHICYCINCKKTAGAGMFPRLTRDRRETDPWLGIGASNNLIIENEKVTIEGAENLTEYTDPNTTSGKPLGRFFCKTCGK
jgi:hypothetical protein